MRLLLTCSVLNHNRFLFIEPKVYVISQENHPFSLCVLGKTLFLQQISAHFGNDAHCGMRSSWAVCYIMEKRHWCLFLTVWTTTIKSQSKTNAEVNATGDVYNPGVCRGSCTLTHTFRVLYTETIVGIQLCWFYWEGCGRLKRRTGRWGYPRFLLCS